MAESKHEVVKNEPSVVDRKATRKNQHVAPRYEVIESEHSYTVRLEMPGVSKDTLEIQADHEILAVRGHRDEPTDGFTTVFAERPDVDYYREFSMDDTVDWEKITATVRDGIVTVDIPKAAHAKPRRISVE